MEGMVDDQWRNSEVPESLYPIYDIAANWAAFESDQNYVDFELLYSAVDSIAEMNPDDLVAIPFAPHRGNAGFYFKQRSGGQVIGWKPAIRHAEDLREILKHRVHDVVGNVDESKAAELYLPLFDCLLNHMRGSTEIKLFTTNYDRAVESIFWEGLHSGQDWKYELVDGFKPSGPAPREFSNEAFDKKPTNDIVLIKLHKLHGSVHWIQQGQTVRASAADDYLQRNVVVYPVRSHKTGTPFATLFQRFKNALREHLDILLVIGSSFRDDHVRSTIRDALARQGGLRTVIVHDPQADELVEELLGSELPAAAAMPAGGYFGREGSLKSIEEAIDTAMNLGPID